MSRGLFGCLVAERIVVLDLPRRLLIATADPLRAPTHTHRVPARLVLPVVSANGNGRPFGGQCHKRSRWCVRSGSGQSCWLPAYRRNVALAGGPEPGPMSGRTAAMSRGLADTQKLNVRARLPVCAPGNGCTTGLPARGSVMTGQEVARDHMPTNRTKTKVWSVASTNNIVVSMTWGTAKRAVTGRSG